MTDIKPVAVKRALISVSDKSGLLALAGVLRTRGVEIISTGGSARTMREAGIEVTDVAEVTGFPEMMDGRIKTLHPKIHGGLLARGDRPQHLAAAAEHAIALIDLLAVNLYPFEETRAATQDRQELIEQIDIGGPAMIRAAAKNHDRLAVLVKPQDYELSWRKTTVPQRRPSVGAWRPRPSRAPQPTMRPLPPGLRTTRNPSPRRISLSAAAAWPVCDMGKIRTRKPHFTAMAAVHRASSMRGNFRERR